MNTANPAAIAPTENTTTVSTKVIQSPSDRFTNAVIRNFTSDNGEIKITEFQKKLCQNYFIKVDQTLKDNEKKRMAKSEQQRDPLAFIWDNVNMSKLAVDVIAFSSVELDPMQPNHISIIPYKNTANNKFDMGFLIGYRGMEIKAKKYGLEVPSDVVYKLVYSTDKFKQYPKDKNNAIESYTLEITDDFNRGEVVGGFWYHEFKDFPEKNKLKVFSLKDIEKRKPKYASAEFWGGLKDKWEYDQAKGRNVIAGTEKIEGWFEEMAIKTISRNAYNDITIDSKKIDDNYLAILQKENDMNDSIIQNQIEANANKEPLDFDEYTDETDPKTLEIPVVTTPVETQNPEPENATQQTIDLDQAPEIGPGF